MSSILLCSFVVLRDHLLLISLLSKTSCANFKTSLPLDKARILKIPSGLFRTKNPDRWYLVQGLGIRTLNILENNESKLKKGGWKQASTKVD